MNVDQMKIGCCSLDEWIYNDMNATVIEFYTLHSMPEEAWSCG